MACGPGSYAAAATAVAAAAGARSGRPCLPKARAVPSRSDAGRQVGGSAWWVPGAAVFSHAQPRRGSACSAARLLMGGQPLKLLRQGCHPLAAPHGAVRPHLFSRSLLALPVGPSVPPDGGRLLSQPASAWLSARLLMPERGTLSPLDPYRGALRRWRLDATPGADHEVSAVRSWLLVSVLDVTQPSHA